MTVSAEGIQNNYAQKDSLKMTEALADRDIKRIARTFISEKSQRIVFVDGQLFRMLSIFDQRFSQDGTNLYIPKGAVVNEPLEILFYARTLNRITNPKINIVCDESSQLTCIEHYVGGSEEYRTDSEIGFTIKENAVCYHYRVQDEGVNALHTSKIHSDVARSGLFKTFTFSFGSKVAKNQVSTDMNGSAVNSSMYGLSVLNGSQEVHNDTLLHHVAPNCESRELYKGIYADKSAGTFIGTIIVEQDAQKTNAIQSNRALLLSDEASIHAQPQLKIWADDVKCTHGATVGQLDDAALFYIQSRGVDKSSARMMLIHAFASEVVSEVAYEPLRLRLEERLEEKLEIASV